MWVYIYRGMRVPGVWTCENADAESAAAYTRIDWKGHEVGRHVRNEARSAILNA